MTATRQDAWTEDDDLLLAEVVLRHIREGSTQLNAFEEVGYRLGRTSAACGFRWNSLVRKKYLSAIQIAKAQRQQRKAKGKNRFLSDAADRSGSSASERGERISRLVQNGLEDAGSMFSELSYEYQNDMEMKNKAYTSTPAYQVDEQQELSLDQVIRFLKQQKESFKKLGLLEKELQDKEQEIKRLREENSKMKRDLGHVQNDYQTMNEDYKALIQIMDRARKLAFLGDEQEEKVSFKMDKNGNLERVEKA